jgi:hypothetical protein
MTDMPEEGEVLRLERIVSGGQTGVDRAALDAAMELGVEVGGWCPRGRLAEDGAIDEAYPLKETPSEQYEERTRWNVRDSDATLILTWGEPVGGTAYTIEIAEELGKPCLIVDLGADGDAELALEWIEEVDPRLLNVAGPREGTRPGAYTGAKAFLQEMLRPLISE